MNLLRKLDKKTLTLIGIGISIIILLIVILITLKIIVGSAITTKTYEKRLKTAATTYFEKHKNRLPKQNGGRISISIEKLENSGVIKSQDKLLKKGVTCKGGVNVSRNNNYYLYQPVIKCSDKYETNLLYTKILEDNPLRQSSDGLYQINNYYLFRGENLNNYVRFADKTWRIVRINKDNTIKLLLQDRLTSISWDDRYNNEKDQTIGKNIYSVSRIKEKLDEYIEGNELFTDAQKAYIVPSNYCIGSRKENDTKMDGSSECSNILENQYLGLLAAYEYGIVSLDKDCKYIEDPECSNYNYLAKLDAFWTITPSSENSYSVYKVNGTIGIVNARTYSKPGIVLNLSNDTLYSSGTGSEDDPYIIK